MKYFQSASLNDNFFKDFYICFCEKTTCPPGHNTGPSLRFHHMILYSISGKAKIRSGKKEYTLTAGQGIFIPPNKSCYYYASKSESWDYICIGFSGKHTYDILSSIGFGENYSRFSYKNSQKLVAIADQMLECTEGCFEQFLLRQSLFYSFLSLISAPINDNKTPETARTSADDYVMQAISFIKQNYYKQIHVNDIANHLGITRNHLFTLFKQVMNHSPQEYIISFRLNHAKALLINTDYSIATIARSCGYEDPAVFSRSFKKKYHISPSKYRNYMIRQSDNLQPRNTIQ